MRDLKLLYELLALWEEGVNEGLLGNPEKAKETIKKYKKIIRNWYSEKDKDRYLVKSNTDDCWIKIYLPEYITSKDEADDYFMENEFIEIIPSQYDCTGRHFTLYYKLGKDSKNRWYAYHHIGIDC